MAVFFFFFRTSDVSSIVTVVCKVCIKQNACRPERRVCVRVCVREREREREREMRKERTRV